MATQSRCIDTTIQHISKDHLQKQSSATKNLTENAGNAVSIPPYFNTHSYI